MNNNYLKTSALPLFLSLFLSAMSSSKAVAQLYVGDTLAPAEISQIINQIKPGSILILGENHGLAAHRDQHMAILNELRNQGFKTSVGLEFLNYPDQSIVNQYLSKNLTDDQFTADVKWQGVDFQFYKQQILFPLPALGETTIALNIPRFVTSKIAKTGLDSLTPEEANFMPPSFHVGRDSYKQRFADVIHVPAGPVFERYFVSQSTWDDTMAWKATEFIKTHPDQVLVIVVGEFHVQFGGGLADRILARDPKLKVISVSQIWAVNMAEDGTVVPMTDDEIHEEIKPSVIYGARGDYIWVSKQN
ncbi:MAG: ChaN family lipoprotein [Pseudobdellovibrio sp.]